MKIYLTTILDKEDKEVDFFYQTLKTYEEQDEEVRNYIEKIINEQEPVPILETFIDGGVTPRLHKQVYWINDNLKIAKVYEYEYPAEHEKNGIIKNIKTEYYGN